MQCAQLRARLARSITASHAACCTCLCQVWNTASTRLYCVAIVGAVLFSGHWALLRLWPLLRITRGAALPAPLVFPRLEVHFWDASLVGVVQAMAMLLAGGAQGLAVAATHGTSGCTSVELPVQQSLCTVHDQTMAMVCSGVIMQALG